MNKKEASKITGGLSAPGKMPEGSYNLPARACQTGAKLREIPGTPCWGCYAFKGRYNFPNVRDALSRRLKISSASRLDPGHGNTDQGQEAFFSWHDSGDIQSVQHLLNIYAVCEATPETQHWLPTQERGLIEHYQVQCPKNLINKIKQREK